MSKHPIKVFTIAVVTTFIFAPLTMQAAAKTVMTGKKIPDYLAEGYAIKGIWGSKIEADYSAGIYETFSTLSKDASLVQCLQRFDQQMKEGVHYCVEQSADDE